MNANTNRRPVAKAWRHCLSVAVLVAFGATLPGLAGAEQLPVFKLAEPRVDTKQADALAYSLSKGAQPVGEYTKTAYIARAGNFEVETYLSSGGFFIRDSKQLWNADLKPALPDRERGRAIADAFLKSSKLEVAGTENVRFSFGGYSETGAGSDIPGVVDKRLLDLHANYKVEIIADFGGRKTAFPVVGGGGDFKVALGDQGGVIGYHGVWRPIVDKIDAPTILTRGEAEERFRATAKGLKLDKVSSYLAYYSAPAFRDQSVLAPVWVVRGEATVSGQKIITRNTYIAATQYGPVFPEIKPIKRVPGNPPPTDDDEGKRASFSLLDFLVKPAHAVNPSEAGTSWIGPSQGLGGSPANAQGFVDELASAGWTINFNWGELAAFESDWNASDDSWVDAADFVFYTGHANMNGWVLNVPGDDFLHFSEVGATPGNPNDKYGQNDLEWVVIAACGPHQHSSFVAGGGNAFDRWRGIFDGLHIFLGYGAVTFDNTDEGERIAELSISGWNVIDAWFRAAWEIQPATNGEAAPNGPTIFVTAMYAHKAGIDTRNDHIWGAPGATVADPVVPSQSRTLMWSGT